jgi:predicted RNA binding protein YcfA (HicA-like mRNA interferase family)
MKAREVIREIERRGGSFTRQAGSHRRYTARATDAEGNTTTAHATVPMHSGDIPAGTLASIERQLESVFGKGWLRK